MDWTSILENIGITGIIVGAISYLAKSITDNLFSKKLTEHQTDLEKQNHRYLERFKTSLQIEAKERELQFSKLHQKRAEVIENLYQLIVDASFFVKSFLSPLTLPHEPNKEEKAKIAFEKLWEMTNYYDRNRIYFEKELCDVLDKFINDIREPARKFKSALRYEDSLYKELLLKLDEIWDQSWDKFTQEVEPAKAELENEFRRILGVK